MKPWVHSLFGFWVAGVVTLALLGISGSLSCATTPKGRARQFAVVQKTAVDGSGAAYLGYCRIVRRPKCIAADQAAKTAGGSQTEEERIACLKPCDSNTAERVQQLVDVVRTEQSALFELLKTSDPTEAEIAAQRKQLFRAARQLEALLAETGINDMLADAVGDEE